MRTGYVKGAISISGNLTEMTSELTSTLYFESLEKKKKDLEHILKILIQKKINLLPPRSH